MSAFDNVNPLQFSHHKPSDSSTPPVMPASSAPTSSGATGGMNAASMWSFSANSKAASSQSGSTANAD